MDVIPGLLNGMYGSHTGSFSGHQAAGHHAGTTKSLLIGRDTAPRRQQVLNAFRGQTTVRYAVRFSFL